MNRQEYIDKHVGHIDVGDRVRFLRPPSYYTAPVHGVVVDIHRGHSINFTVDCEDATGKKFQFYNARLDSLEKVDD